MTRDQIEFLGIKGATDSNDAKILNSFYLKIDKEELSVGQWLSIEGFWESWITSWITKNIKSGDVCVDVGSNYGYYTRIMEILAGKTGMVYAVEANKKLYDLFLISIDEYPIEDGADIKIHNLAISDSKGTVTLNIPPQYLGGSSIVWGKENLPSSIEDSLWTDSSEVESDTLDELLKDVDHINLIKIDIEGAEPLAWKGMSEVINKTDIIVIEVGEYSPSEFIDSLYESHDLSYINFDGEESKMTRDEFNNLTDLVMLVLRKKSDQP
jgi:FkbM family methyltransferase